MLTFPLVGPPAGPGIYLIKNSTTGQVYVGASRDLRRRYSTWRGVFGSGLGATNKELDTAVRGSNVEDWVFHVFMECPVDQLFDMERKVIDSTRDKIGDKLLNHTLPFAVEEPRPPSQQSVPLTGIVDENGKNLTYAEAAERAGCARETMKKRLAKWRKVGKTRFVITDLT